MTKERSDCGTFLFLPRTYSLSWWILCIGFDLRLGKIYWSRSDRLINKNYNKLSVSVITLMVLWNVEGGAVFTCCCVNKSLNEGQSLRGSRGISSTCLEFNSSSSIIGSKCLSIHPVHRGSRSQYFTWRGKGKVYIPHCRCFRPDCQWSTWVGDCSLTCYIFLDSLKWFNI